MEKYTLQQRIEILKIHFKNAENLAETILEFHRKIILSDEAHFHLGGFVNKWNCLIWGSENPRIIVEKPLYPQRVTVWCGLWSGGVIGPYFF